MKKLLVLAAAAGMLSAISGPLPAFAAEGANCDVFPRLKAECRAALRAAAADAAATTVAAAGTVASATMKTTGAVVDAIDDATGWHCERTKGGKALFACSK